MALSTIEKKGLLSRRDTGRIIRLLNTSISPLHKKSIKTEELTFFIDQLSLMLDTGTPLNKSIHSVASQIKNRDFKNILFNLSRDIEEGKLLSDAMAKYPHIFNSVYISMIRAGESGGFLKEMLERIVSLEERQQEFLSTVKATMYYPVFLTIFAISVVFFIVIFIFPQFGSMFQEIYDSLPITTKILMNLSNIVITYWYILLFLVISVWGVIYKLIISEKGRMYIDVLKLKIPVFKDFFTKLYVSRLTRILGAMISGNVPLLESLNICSNAIGNKVFSRLIDNIRESVESGKPLSAPIVESSYFPETVKQMIKTGEDSGTLHRVMPKLADYYEKDIEKSLKKITTIMEPLLLVAVGGIIGIVVVSLIIPIFKLTRTIH